MPSGQSGDRSRAYAINNLTDAQVVGANIQELVGVLWERDGGGTWSAIDLNTEIPCCRQSLLIREAHDINDNGWIVAWAEYLVPNSSPPVIERWAVLLSPYACPEDVDFDGDIDEYDLNQVWWSDGSCAGPDYPNGDVNNDCAVDGYDFEQIMKSYGPCGGEGSGLSELVIETWMAAGGSDGIDSETILISEVADALEESTVGDRVAALFDLID
jgi:hypothetical protein